ncbi:MAG TPA: hypothetical protein VMN03_13520 [Burkholderiales bacterium]|nr:hypothetical protein [Burkholderiales bacterium]
MTPHQHHDAGNFRPAFLPALALTLAYACIEAAGGLWYHITLQPEIHEVSDSGRTSVIRMWPRGNSGPETRIP